MIGLIPEELVVFL